MADQTDPPRSFDLGNIDAADLPMASDQSAQFQTDDEVRPDFSSIPTEGDVPKVAPKEASEQPNEPPTKPATPSEPEKKVEAPKEQPQAEKVKEPPKEEEIDPDLKAELDAIKIKPNTPDKIKSDIAKVRAIAERERKAVKAERQRLVELQVKLEEAEKAPKVDDNLQKKIKELEDFRAKIQFSDDRELNDTFDKKTSEAETGIFNLLKSAGLPDESAEAMKKTGLQSYSAQWWKQHILDKVGDVDPFKAREIENAVLAWKGVAQERETKKAEFIANRQSHYKEQEEKAVEHWKKWGGEVEKTVLGLAKGHDWTQPKEIPPNASPEKKAEIEAFNSRLESRRQEFGQTVDKLAALDPKTVANITFKAFHADELMGAVEQQKKDLQARDERIAQLEEDAAKRNQAGRSTHRQSIAVGKEAGKKKADHADGPIDLDQAWRDAGMGD